MRKSRSLCGYYQSFHSFHSKCVRLDIHDVETNTLHSHLENAQQHGKTRQTRDLATAGDIAGAFREDEDVSEGRGAGCGPEQDEIWRDAEGAAQLYDANVLREVREDDADEYQARVCQLRRLHCLWIGRRAYMDRMKVKLTPRGRASSAQCGDTGSILDSKRRRPFLY